MKLQDFRISKLSNALYVHSKDTEVQYMTSISESDLHQLNETEFRQEKVQGIVEEVFSRNFDGVNFDYEGPTYSRFKMNTVE